MNWLNENKEIISAFVSLTAAVVGLFVTLFIKAFNSKKNFKALSQDFLNLKEQYEKFKTEAYYTIKDRNDTIVELKLALQRSNDLIKQQAAKMHTYDTKIEAPYILELENQLKEKDALLKNVETELSTTNKTLNELQKSYDLLKIEAEKQKQRAKTLKGQIDENNEIKSQVEAIKNAFASLLTSKPQTPAGEVINSVKNESAEATTNTQEESKSLTGENPKTTTIF